MRSINFIILLLLVSCEGYQLYAQCKPAASDVCTNVQVLCSLDEINGYACKNTSQVPSHCQPLCSAGGVGHNTSWWGFVTQGGNVSISLTVGKCNMNQGLQIGIWGDCFCGEEIICNSIPCLSPFSVTTVNAKLKPCKLYYLWVDGCSDDLCDFTLNTTGGGPPSLTTIGFINNIPGKIIGPFCTNACNLNFFINPQPGGCEPTYVWTLDGKVVGGNNTNVHLNFPNEGDFKICVTAYIGNPLVGAICSKDSTQCATIQVRKSKVLNNQLKTFCNESFNNLKDTNCIYKADGTYSCDYTDSACCHILETGTYVVLDVPATPDIYYISCDNSPFVDILGRTYSLCEDHLLVNLPQTTNPFKCDSAIILTAVNVNLEAQWSAKCVGGFIELSPNAQIISPCSSGESYQFDYKWYKGNDPLHKALSPNDRLIVDAVNEDYCVEVNLHVRLGTQTAICTKTFCELINEGDLAPKCFPLVGDVVLCKSNFGSYRIDTILPQNVLSYNWIVKGGTIISKLDSSGVAVNWNLTANDSGTICVFYNTDCGQSCQRCLTVFLNATIPDAGPQDSICFFNYVLHGITKAGTPSWKLLSGPGTSNFVNPNSAITNIQVGSVGTYVYQLTEDFKGCFSKDTVAITFWDAPGFVNLIVPECDNTAEHYRIQVDGQNGDRASWKIDAFTNPGGLLTGSFIAANTWRTDWIPNNEVYQLIINDRHNCLPDTLSNTFECTCINSIGILDKAPIILCLDGIAQANYKLNSGNPDGNDIIRFLLYDGNPQDPLFGNHLSFNSNGSFVFDPNTMQLGKVYYIAVLMANQDPNNPDKVLLNDRCLKFDVVSVIWYDNPKAVINGPDTITCSKPIITLDGGASVSGSGTSLLYLWSTTNGIIVDSTKNATATINAPGSYKLVVTDSLTKCTNEIVFIVNKDASIPTVEISPPQIINCNQTSVILDGSASSQGNQYQIQWVGPGNIMNVNSYNPAVSIAGTYVLIITNIISGCADSFSVNVISDQIKPIPDISSSGQLTCTVRQVQLDASGTKAQLGSILSYNWQTVNGNILSGLGTPIITVDKAGTYQLQVKNQNNACDSILKLDIVEIINPFGGFDLISKDPKCFGEQSGEIEVTGIIAKGPLNGLQYLVNNKIVAGNTDFTNLTPGTYQIKVKDSNGCEHDTTVILVEPDKLNLNLIKEIVVNQDSLVDLEKLLLNVSGGVLDYQDTTWLNLNQNMEWTNLQYNADTTREFLITVTDASGCQIQDRIKVIVRIPKNVWWPNVFTPNGDGINDFWNLKGKKIRNIRMLNIYDRWGELVHIAQNIRDGSVDPIAGWNGIFKGEKALPGVYVFYAELEYYGAAGIDKYKGEFTLIR